MRITMSFASRRELLAKVAPRYREATRKQKTVILNEFISSTGYKRKYAIRLLSLPEIPIARAIKRPRARFYGEAVQEALKIAWCAANCIASKRLSPFLAELVPVLERHGHLELNDKVRHQLISISSATIDRILKLWRSRSGRGTTKRGSLLKHQVPVRTFADWEEKRPGFFEADLVAHCGWSMEGSILYTLTLTDIATTWTECLPLLYRGQDAIRYLLEPFDDGFYLPVPYEEYDLNYYSERSIKKDFKLNPYFKALDEKIERFQSFKEKSPTDKRGRPIKAKNIIALIWSYIMRKGNRCDWKGMADLFDWFSYNLKGTYYGDRIKPKSEEDTFDEHNLKREVLRLKANLKKNDFLRKRIETLKNYYFSHKDLEKMSTVDFTYAVLQADSNVPMVGGEQESGLIWDKNLLVIFPDEKYLARPGRPLERIEEMKIKVVPEIHPKHPTLIKKKYIILYDDED